jgi:hypothetical protein
MVSKAASTVSACENDDGRGVLGKRDESTTGTRSL